MANGVYMFMWTTRNGEIVPICGSDAVKQLDGRKKLSNLIADARDCIVRSYYYGRDPKWVTHFSIGRLESHDPNDVHSQSILRATVV